MEGGDSQDLYYQTNDQTLYPTENSFQPMNEPVFQPVVGNQPVFKPVENPQYVQPNGQVFNQNQQMYASTTTTTHSNNQNNQNMSNVQPVQQMQVQQVQEPEAMNDLLFAVIILVVGLFVFPLALPLNVLFLKSKNAGAKVIAIISLVIFVLELVFFCVMMCITVLLTLVTLVIYALVLIIPFIVLAIVGGKK
eukprot:gene6257-10265_t